MSSTLLLATRAGGYKRQRIRTSGGEQKQPHKINTEHKYNSRTGHDRTGQDRTGRNYYPYKVPCVIPDERRGFWSTLITKDQSPAYIVASYRPVTPKGASCFFSYLRYDLWYGRQYDLRYGLQYDLRYCLRSMTYGRAYGMTYDMAAIGLS